MEGFYSSWTNYKISFSFENRKITFYTSYEGVNFKNVLSFGNWRASRRDIRIKRSKQASLEEASVSS